MEPADRISTDRIEWIDCAKGMAIILVIIGHTVGGRLRGIIFSFHMPLFFILSCAAFTCSANKKQWIAKTMRGVNRLIAPAFFMFVLEIFTYIVKNYKLFTDIGYIGEYIKDIILIGIFSSGVPVSVLSCEIPAIGIPWFLVVLFLGRTLFDGMHMKLSEAWLITGCLILSVVGVCLGRIQWLPLSFDILLAIMPMFYIGLRLGRCNVENRPLLKLLLSGMIWAGTFFLFYDGIALNYLELACRRYTLYPICYVTAVAGTVFVVECSVIFGKNKLLCKPFLFLGKNSLYLLFIHVLDYSWFEKLWRLTDNSYWNSIFRVLVDVAILTVFLFIAGRIKHHTK